MQKILISTYGQETDSIKQSPLESALFINL